VETRIRNKFRQLVSLLINKDISLITRGRLYSSCVLSTCSMLHGSETCGVKVLDRVPNKELRERPDDIISLLQQIRFCWYGHVLQKEDNDSVKKCMKYEVEGARKK